ncbi:class I SAM-dependent methyltransferase [Candidatus Gracilibacteria bacterium]|nr:class I SAM-dependent methyltransferase [Candidatus Gracilibacteria bacterium]
MSHIYLEKPAIYSLLPKDLSSKTIYCLGSGSGQECDYIMNLGVKKVIGSDNSANLLEYAQLQYPLIEFELNDMNNLKLESNSNNIVFSSLAFHYIDNWNKLLKSVHQSLKRDGELIISTHHPIKWGAAKKRTKHKNQFLLGYQKSKTDNTQYKIWGNYLGIKKK